MSISTILMLLRHIPELAELADAGEALATTPELVRFDAALSAFQAAMGAKAAEPVTKTVVEPLAPIGGHPHGTESGRIQ